MSRHQRPMSHQRPFHDGDTVIVAVRGDLDLPVGAIGVVKYHEPENSMIDVEFSDHDITIAGISDTHPALMLARYTREGRCIHDDGLLIIRIERVVDDLRNSHITPHDCDRLAAHIVKLLNDKPLPQR